MRRYRVLAQQPNGRRLLLAALIFYPGQSGLGICVLLALHQATGSFATAGAAGAAETICFSLSSLAQGRWLDRRDPRVLTGMTVAFTLVIAAMIVALTTGAGAIVLIGLTAAIGSTLPGTGAAMRAAWSSLLTDGDDRATAFAFLSIAQDAGFMLGPAVLAAIATIASAQLALGCGCALIGVGTLLVVAVTRPGPSESVAHPAGPGAPSLRATIGPVALALFMVGIAFGAIDISCAAFATEHHHQPLAGVLLAAVSAGSITGGLWYGSRTWRSALPTRLRWCLGLMGGLALGPSLAPNLLTGIPLLVVAGVAAGPALTTAYLLASECVAPDRQTEAYSILAVAINGGAALGGVLAGQLVAGGSAHDGFLLATASPLLGCGLLALTRVATLGDSRARTGRASR